jgi:hypothetical protein
MLQRQIVVKALCKQIDIEDPECTKYTIAISIAWMFISIIGYKVFRDQIRLITSDVQQLL